MNTLLLQWIGYVGSVIVAVSLTMNSIKKLRWYNLIGAAVFSFYGFAIGALPVGLLNLFIVLADIYYIYKMYSYQESFKAITADLNDPYLNYFIDFYQHEIKNFFPSFDKMLLKKENGNNSLAFLLLRNTTVAGVFMGIIDNHTLTVHLDFVTIEYRDLKPGDFIYKKNIAFLKDLHIHQIRCNTDNKIHKKYLVKMGFEQAESSQNIYVKNI
jgi:hypothetical protein